MLDLNVLFAQGLVTRPTNFDTAEDEQIFNHLFGLLNVSSDKTLDADTFLVNLASILHLTDLNACRLNLNNGFLTRYPEFYAFIKNMNPSAVVEVGCCEKIRRLTDPSPTQYNCMLLKSISNEIHEGRWARDATKAEEQGGVSVLGKISELLASNELQLLVSDENYFYNSSQMQPHLRSYGDFVLMCQPNNLWVSVKSGFARERLLASGYTNDVIGVGFFQSAKEFTNIQRLKNHKKAGFLAIYIPDEPVTNDQIRNNINTYDAVKDSYGGEDSMPVNINETPLLRKLSDLHGDLKAIVDIDLKQRNLSNF